MIQGAYMWQDQTNEFRKCHKEIQINEARGLRFLKNVAKAPETRLSIGNRGYCQVHLREIILTRGISNLVPAICYGSCYLVRLMSPERITPAQYLTSASVDSVARYLCSLWLEHLSRKARTWAPLIGRKAKSLHLFSSFSWLLSRHVSSTLSVSPFRQSSLERNLWWPRQEDRRPFVICVVRDNLRALSE